MTYIAIQLSRENISMVLMWGVHLESAAKLPPALPSSIRVSRRGHYVYTDAPTEKILLPLTPNRKTYKITKRGTAASGNVLQLLRIAQPRGYRSAQLWQSSMHILIISSPTQD